MQPLLAHYCKLCSCSTDIPFSAAVFSQNHSCSHCGAISMGINVQDKQTEEANMQQDELARLFSAHMSLSQANAPRESEAIQQASDGQRQDKQNHEYTAQPIVYASQHYTHSYHVIPTQPTNQAPMKTHIEASELGEVLLRNSIDPALLFPSQIDLFQNADDDQRLRLLELWRISPPQGRQGFPDGIDYSKSRQLYDWPPTSLAQEEAMARLRYESTMGGRTQQEEIQKHQELLDQSMSSCAQSGAVHQARDLLESSPDRAAEPYIVSGYDMLARREYEESAIEPSNLLKESTRYNQAIDPVYDGPLWQKNVGSLIDMENQYGAFSRARDHDVHPIYVDDEMVM